MQGCPNKAKYCIEWWSLNQYGKNPYVVDERYSCAKPDHLIALSEHKEYGGYPDEINTVEGERVKPELLSLVKKAMDKELDIDTIDDIVYVADAPKEQLKLFPEF